MRLIDADAFERAVMFSDDEDLQDVIYRLRDFPTANVVETPRWIPVNERLPEDEDSVLVTDCKWWIDIAFYDGLNWWYLDAQQLKADVSAWMPLPEPYRKEAEDE